MTDVSTVFPDAQTPPANPDDQATLEQNIQREAFNSAVQEEVRRQLLAQGALPTGDFQVADGPSRLAFDSVTETHYGGLISPELVKAYDDGNQAPVWAVQKTIVKNRQGDKVSVWYPTPQWDGISPRPGEWRQVHLVEDSNKDAS